MAAAANAHKARDACRAHLQALSLDAETSAAIERGVFNECQRLADGRIIPRDWGSCLFRELYADKARSAIVNVDPAHNPELRARLDAGDVAPRVLARLPPELLMPAKWRDIKDSEFKRNELIASGGVVHWTDQYRCGVCKQRQCRVVEVQTRSADEPMTIFVSCKCGHRWRGN